MRFSLFRVCVCMYFLRTSDVICKSQCENVEPLVKKLLCILRWPQPSFKPSSEPLQGTRRHVAPVVCPWIWPFLGVINLGVEGGMFYKSNCKLSYVLVPLNTCQPSSARIQIPLENLQLSQSLRWGSEVSGHYLRGNSTCFWSQQLYLSSQWPVSHSTLWQLQTLPGLVHVHLSHPIWVCSLV